MGDLTGVITGVAMVVAIVAAGRSVWSPCGLSMLSSINPIAERSRGHRYPVTAGWFVAGATLGGAAIGVPAAVLAWLLGRLLAATGVSATALCWAGAAAALVCLAADRRWWGFTLPEHPRQVNETWLVRYRRWIYAAGFGVQIGSGFATYIMTAGVYFTAVAAVLTADPMTALLVWVVFGAARGLAVLMSARVGSPADLATLHSRLAARAAWSAKVAAAALGGAAFGLAGAALGLWWPAVVAGLAVLGFALTGLALTGFARADRTQAPKEAPVCVTE